MKSGYKTAGFWAAAVTTGLAALVASGALPTWATQGAAAVGAAIASAGYASWRSFAKGGPGDKPAWRTTEFWLSVVAALVTGLVAAGAFPTGSAGDRVLAGLGTLLALAGYGARHSLPPVAKR